MIAAPKSLVGPIALGVVGGLLLMTALWVLRGRREDSVKSADKSLEQKSKRGQSEPEVERTEALGSHLSIATRHVLGVSLLLLGYHALAYALPATYLPLRVPIDRLWMLGVGVVAANMISLAMDRLTKD
jgi:hypothetical protein